MLGKRCASEMEASLTEYYRQECLRALYAKQQRPRDCAWVSKDMMAKPPRRARKRVTFATVLEIIGSADAKLPTGKMADKTRGFDGAGHVDNASYDPGRRDGAADTP